MSLTNPPLAYLLLFAVLWVVLIYSANCLIAGKLKHLDVKQALMHIAAMSMIGLLGEIFVGSVYHFLFNEALWNYTVLPIHHAYTSQYAAVLWGIYGLHLYLLHGTLQSKRNINIHRIALIFCGEAILIELLVNLSFKLLFGKYVFYYSPSDLWHFTSIQTLPFYLVAGYVVAVTFRKFEKDASFYAAMCGGIILVLVFMT